MFCTNNLLQTYYENSYLPIMLLELTSIESFPSDREADKAALVRVVSISLAVTFEVLSYSTDKTVMTLPFRKSINAVFRKP